MKKTIFILSIVLYSVILFSNSNPDTLNSNSFTFGIGGNIFPAFGYMIDLGYTVSKTDIYIRYTKLNGYIEADMIELRMTYFKQKEKRGIFFGGGIGYADYEQQPLYGDAKSKQSKTVTMCGEVGFSVRPGLKLGIDVGSKPGFIYLFLSIKIF